MIFRLVSLFGIKPQAEVCALKLIYIEKIFHNLDVKDQNLCRMYNTQRDANVCG